MITGVAAGDITCARGFIAFRSGRIGRLGIVAVLAVAPASSVCVRVAGRAV